MKYFGGVKLLFTKKLEIMVKTSISFTGDFVTERTIFDLSRAYVKRMYEKGHNLAEEAFSLKLTKAELEIMLGLMVEGDSIEAFNGLHSDSDGTWHTFTVVVVGADGKVKPVTDTYTGAQRWEPGKKIIEVVGEGTLKAGACCKIKKYFVI